MGPLDPTYFPGPTEPQDSLISPVVLAEPLAGGKGNQEAPSEACVLNGNGLTL